MSIRPHPSHKGWYIVDHYPDGRNGKRAREPFPSYEEARNFEQALGKNKTAPAKTTHPRLEDVVENYLLAVKDTLAPTTYATKERRLNSYIIPFLGKYRVKDLRQTQLDEYKKTVAFWTYHTDLNCLLALITWMVGREQANPLTFKPERPKGEPKVKPIPHPADMIRAIENMKNPKHRILFSLMLYTGLRWNEASNLRWEDVDLKSETVAVKEIKRGKQDSVAIPKSLLAWFEDHKMVSGLIFEGRFKGKPYKPLWKVLMQAGVDAGVHISNHTFRHASGTYLYEQTNDIYLVQHHLRHSKVTTSQIYARMSVTKRQSAVASVFDYVVKQNNEKS